RRWDVADVKESTEQARSLVTKPFEEAESSAGDSDGERSAVTRTLMVAGAAALAGGLAGAAQDWLSRREASEAEGDEPEARAEEEDEPRAEEPQDDEQDAADEPEGGDEDGPRDEHGNDEGRHEHGDGGGGAGAPLGRVGKLVRGAAGQLEQLVGAEAEGVSAM